MSVTRIIKVNIDLDIMESIALKFGRRTMRNGYARLFNSKLEQCDLVIESKGSYDIGFRETADGVEVIYDEMCSSDYGQLLAQYYEEIVTTKLGDSFELTKKVSSTENITLLLRRK